MSNTRSAGEPLSRPDLKEIRTLLATSYCNPTWRRHVELLAAEVERLTRLLDTVARFGTTKSRSPGETSLV